MDLKLPDPTTGLFALSRRSLSDKVLLAVSFAIIALSATWAFLAHPALDDFCFANLGGNVMVDSYRAWSGRWFTFGLLGAFFPGSDFSPYWPSILIGLSLWWASFILAVKDWRLGTVMFALFISMMPSLGEGLFWATNVIAYTLPIFFAVMAIRAPWYLAGPAAIICCGGSEFVGAFLLCLLIVRRDWKVAAFCFAGLAINALAPGNFVRAEQVERGSLPLALFHTFRNYDSVLSMAFDPRLILLCLCVPDGKGEKWAALPILGIAFAAVFAFVLLFGGPPPGRILDVLCLAIIIGAVQMARAFPKSLPLQLPFALTLLVSPNVGLMVRDLPDALRSRPTAVLPPAYLPDNFSERCYSEWRQRPADRGPR